MVVIRYALAFFVPEITFAAAILKETLIWIERCCVARHCPSRRTLIV
jgi:hypothetical protein